MLSVELRVGCQLPMSKYQWFFFFFFGGNIGLDHITR